MPDISKCPGTNCPLREACYRYTSRPSEYRQAWINPPVTEEGTCKILTSADRNQDPEEKMEGVTLLGSVYALKHCKTGELLKLYPWDVWDPDGFDRDR